MKQKPLDYLVERRQERETYSTCLRIALNLLSCTIMRDIQNDGDIILSPPNCAGGDCTRRYARRTNVYPCGL